MKSLTDEEISILNDIFCEVQDKIRHYEDAEMGWGESEITAFFNLSTQLHNEAMARKFWWAR